LFALGLLAGGDLVSGKYSIGGADSRVPNTLGPALGLDKHGVFEVDGSITREDVYFGNNANFILQRWNEYVAITDKHGGDFEAQSHAEDNVRKDNPTRFYRYRFAKCTYRRAPVTIILVQQIPSF
jgi:hypothetical protein